MVKFPYLTCAADRHVLTSLSAQYFDKTPAKDKSKRHFMGISVCCVNVYHLQQIRWQASVDPKFPKQEVINFVKIR